MSARSRIFIVASAESGVFSDGFQITGSPQTSASAAFQDQTATGKLKADMIAHGPSGCQVSVMRWPGRSDAMARPYNCRDRPDGEIADVDHLLHFAEALGDDLADLQGHQRAKGFFRGAQLFAEQAHELAPARRGDLAPGEEGCVGALDDRRHVGGRRLPDAGDLGAVDRRADGERAVPKPRPAVNPARSRTSSLVMGRPHSLLICVSASGPARPRGCDGLFRPQIRSPGKPRLGPGLASDW